MAEGNRKDPRARVLNMTVRYKSATVDEFIENHSHDISKGGIFIKTRSPFPAGTLLKFEVRIAEDQKLMQGVGRVVWRREPDRAEENFPAGMGIKFIKTAEGSAELISQIVAARQGVESSFDAGVRESGVSLSAPPPVSMPALGESPSMSELGRATMVGPGPLDSERTPALHVESGPRSFPLEAETTVSSPPKKRSDQNPDKRKVVLQGPALEGPPSSKTKTVAVSAPSVSEERAPSRSTRQGSSLAEETTARRIRPASAGARRSGSPSIYGLVAILGALALGVVLLNRSRNEEPAEIAAPQTPIAAEPVAPPPVIEQAPEPAAALPTPPEPSVAAAEVPAEAPSATEPAVPPPPPSAAVSPPATAPAPPAPAAAPAPKPAAAKPPSPPPVAAAPAPRPAAPPRPKAPPPAAEAPREGVAIIKPSDEPAPPSAAPPAAAAPAEPSPSEKKKPAGTAPPQQAAPAPSAPTPTPPAPAPPPASDDNPY